MNGFFLIDKEIGWTSRDICNKISHLFHEKKVGHIGTLDPFATGLLVVTVGKGTKAGAFLADDYKEYIATLSLGVKTNTGDLTGEKIQCAEVPNLTKKDIEDVLTSFLGKSEQLPPMFSAVHHQGKKLYQLAREGKDVERKKRQIDIKNISLMDFSKTEITFRVTASKGTYIRTLGEDIAFKLNTVGHLSSLRRIKIGSLNVESASLISSLKEDNLLSIYQVLSLYLPIVVLSDHDVIKAESGLPFEFDIKDNKVLLIDKKQNVIAVYQKNGDNKYVSLRGLF